GSLGETGSVNYLFERKGRLFIERTEETDEDAVMMAALEAGADDIVSTEDGFEILTDPSEFLNVKEALEVEGLEFVSAEVDMVPSVYADLTEEQQEQFMNMIDALEDDDDVQNVYSNASDE